MSISGLLITLLYGTVQLVLAIALAISIYVYCRKKGEKLKFIKFLYHVWKLRGVFTPLVIHIYDTSTDIGVLHEWYFLAQREKNGDGIKSLDMERLFWIAMGFMIVYRFLLGCVGILAFETFWDRVEKNSCMHKKCVNFCKFLFGFLGGALELGIFVKIYEEQRKKFGTVQKIRKHKQQTPKQTQKQK